MCIMQSATFVALLMLLKTVHLSINGTSNIVKNMKYLLDINAYSVLYIDVHVVSVTVNWYGKK